MSIFYCNRCGRNRDSDRIDVVEDPRNKHELMCLDHQEDDEDEARQEALDRLTQLSQELGMYDADNSEKPLASESKS